jgi:hypothetical protein
MPSARLNRGPAKALGVTLVILAVIGLIGASPWVLRIYTGPTAQWERLSFIGQTYGAASALLTVFALAGIVATLALQARDTKIAREEARRAAVGELLRMAMDDPDLDEAWGPVPEGEDRKARRQLMYINMIISEWQMSFETKALGEKRLRAISREMFSGHPGRTFWREAGEVRINTSETRRSRRFHQILDEEYKHACELISQPKTDALSRRLEPRDQALLAGVTAGGLLVASLAVRAMLRRTSRRKRPSWVDP